ncbi:DUF2244 domain-containing protein [Mitsuaria sp. WAJ17]|uniref:DUF2244 domain-containing protein n=1 Tax=Mitsuaria sp. WAJ17 TaxID=2761452 RepID=UPI00160373B9|nr:DUF2244 domain-containing protein [Mitsuaria sp. WAJ17]MBB2485849.1 DUF2244 domain-containing protein [Mitsuaria sp. WAJ17]
MAREPLQRWELRRRSSLQPGRLLVACALPCGLSLSFGLAFAAVGSPWPLVFAMLQAAAMGMAALVQARHGGDRAVLTVRDGWLEVIKRRGSRQSVCNLPLACLRMRADARGLRLECGSTIVRIRGYASSAACAAVLRDLEQARRRAVANAALPGRGAAVPAADSHFVPFAAC